MAWLIHKVSGLRLICTSLSIGLVGGFIFFFLKMFRVVEVRGYERWKFESKDGKGVLLLHRHSSMRETVFLPMILSREYMRHPLKSPCGTPDSKNYYDKWWFFIARPIAISVPRGNQYGQMRALREMLCALQSGRIIILAPEGGRTFKGKEFKRIDEQGRICTMPRPQDGVDLTQPIIRRFQPGVALLAHAAVVVPVWVVSGRGWSQRITIGTPFSIDSSVPREEIRDILEAAMLHTAVS
ncbi:MAG: hypothetical protein UY78_C0015G0002 [Parcubacteria group bacterium GW2011_GWA1_53_13]|uniref:Phospholipid/glycerol acyltransferase domain-containing protein n=1 Tax=Candidatus Giovannonibacteria bacterium GW2011_GWB1_47_6b TaxID=1618655 RepID=A0A0G1T320_9BACT|nr:MAG: hypothetical protein UY02_C0030G0003 [Candidatus Giovannonibacteria bacterium GW2011_GWB1_47_6b]KKW33297.1 MAG: hypothetical protein UY78_C0015G0002 [Parcubacteria group bacterium GW2011_GWA1_53_13]